jgi:sulfur-carrier protein adenylyltransferase/sulfurtransferase
VLGVLPGVIGSLQAMEVIKLILQLGEPLIGKLLHYDSLSASTRHFNLRRDPHCSLCGDSPSIRSLAITKFNNPTQPRPMKEVTVQTLKQLFDDDKVEFLLDVRMPDEYALANLGGVLIPLPLLEASLDEIPRNKAIIIHCKAGVRSARACSILLDAGFTDVTNVIGGIDAWRKEIDPSLPLTV